MAARGVVTNIPIQKISPVFKWRTALPACKQNSTALLWNSSSDPVAFLLCGRVFSHQLFLWHVFAYNTIPTAKHPFPLSISYEQDRSDNTIVFQNRISVFYGIFVDNRPSQNGLKLHKGLKKDAGKSSLRVLFLINDHTDSCKQKCSPNTQAVWISPKLFLFFF